MGYKQFRGLYGTLGWIRRGALGLSAFFAMMLKADLGKIDIYFGPSASNTIKFIQEWAWLGIPSLIFIAWVVGQIRGHVGDPVTWDELQKVLTHFRNRVFADGGSGYEFHRRATFFKYTRWTFSLRRLPWTPCLVAVVRSGTTTQDCSTVFRMLGKEKKIEGVAGQAWLSDRVVFIENLPDMQSPRCTEDERAEYAEATHMSVDGIKENPPQGRSFYAIKVEVSGKAWGVLVLDSKQLTINKQTANNRYKDYVKVFPLLLRRI